MEKGGVKQYFKNKKAISSNEFLSRKRKREIKKEEIEKEVKIRLENKDSTDYSDITDSSCISVTPGEFIIKKSILHLIENSTQGSTVNLFSKLSGNLKQEVIQFLKYKEIKELIPSIKNKKLTENLIQTYNKKILNPALVKTSTSNITYLKKTLSFPYHSRDLFNPFEDYLLHAKDLTQISQNFSLRQITYVPEIKVLLMTENVSDFLHLSPGEKVVRRVFKPKYLIRVKYLGQYKVALIFLTSVSIFNLSMNVVEKEMKLTDIRDIYYSAENDIYVLADYSGNFWKFDAKAFSEETAGSSRSHMMLPNSEGLEPKMIPCKQYNPNNILVYTSLQICLIDLVNFQIIHCLSPYEDAGISELFYCPGTQSQVDILISIGSNSEIKIWRLKDLKCTLRITVGVDIKQTFYLNKISSDFLIFLSKENKLGVLKLKLCTESEPEKGIKYMDANSIDFSMLSYDSNSHPKPTMNFHITSRNENTLSIFTINKDYNMIEYLYEIK